MFISSLQNKQVLHLVKLRKKQYRISCNEIIIDDWKAIAVFLKHKLNLKCVYYCPSKAKTDEELELLKLLEKHRINIINVDFKVFKKISYGDIDYGFVALAQYPSAYRIENLKLTEKPLIVILDNIEKPGNIGAILRTCDSVQCAAVFVCSNQTDLFNPNIIRASKGICFSLPYINISFDDASSFLKMNNIQPYVLTPDATKSYLSADLKMDSAVIIGNEHHGVGKKWRDISENLYIPMKGEADSLNVSVALTILLYEAVRQRIKF